MRGACNASPQREPQSEGFAHTRSRMSSAACTNTERPVSVVCAERPHDGGDEGRAASLALVSPIDNAEAVRDVFCESSRASSPSSPLCSLRGCSSTLEVSISPVLCLAACETVTSGTPRWRARLPPVRRCFADATVLTACWFPLLTIVFLCRLSAADAAPTDSTDPGDSFAGAAAAVGTLGPLAIAAANRLSSTGPASTSGKNSAGSKPLSLCVLFVSALQPWHGHR